MAEPYWEHARAVHGTVRMIQEGILREFGSSRLGMEDCCPDLTFPQYNALLAVRDAGTLGVKHLAERLNVSPPSASTMVDRLVEMHLLQREQNPADRRSVLIHLSEEGQRTIDAMETGILHFIVELMEELGDDRVREWRGVYDKISDILTKRRADAGTEPVQA